MKKELSQEINNCIQVISDLVDLEGAYNNGEQVILQARKKLRDDIWKQTAEKRLNSLGYSPDIEEAGEQVVISFQSKIAKKPSDIPWINIILFLLTVLSTMATGAMFFEGQELWRNPAGILKGAPFSFWLLAILVFHEFGHYSVSKARGVSVTLPYFIPGPTILGTFGAFIRSKSPFKNRRDLLEVAAAGPIAGFFVAILAIAIGLSYSQIVPATSGGIRLGDSLLFYFIAKVVVGNIPANTDILLHPIAFAGWAGLLVTMLNLIPIGQLDGGHITYALFGKKQKMIGWLFLALMLPLGYFWNGWLLWFALAMIMRVSHPPTLNDQFPLSIKHKLTGWFTILIFILCFIPVPFK